MSRARLLFVAAALLATGAAPHATVPATFSGYETRITSNPGDQYDPAISGDVVVFTDFRSTDTDVYYADATTTAEHPVVVTYGNQQLTGVSNGRVVYTDYRTVDVVVFNTADGTTSNLTRADKEALGRNFNSVDPAIDGDLVAWQDSRDGNMEIYAMNLATGEERRVTSSLETNQRPVVSGTLIGYESCLAGGTCDIWTYDWSTDGSRQITNTPACNERAPSIDGQKLVYSGDCSGDNDIYAVDLATETTRQLVLAGDQANPHVSGDFVSFDDLSDGLYHIKLWHPPTGDVFQVTTGTSGQYLNDIDGNRIVYTDDRNGDLDIYMFTFNVEFTSADTEPPAIAGATDVTVDATSPSGARVALNVTATDNVDPAPVLTCTSPLDAIFAIGVTEVSCYATDSSGNSSAAARFSVHVCGATEQLASLSDMVASLNLRRGIENSLDAKLNAALAALDAARVGATGTACSVLGAFVNEVGAQTGKTITSADAATLLAAVQQIRAVLGCA